MRRWIVACAAVALAAATATPAGAATQLVYRVDSVIAKTIDNHLVVTAKGAVVSGGWTLPRLHINPFRVPESDAEVIEFLATPPVAEGVVIQALLPITTTAVFPLPHYGTTEVTVVTQSNSVTVPIQ